MVELEMWDDYGSYNDSISNSNYLIPTKKKFREKSPIKRNSLKDKLSKSKEENFVNNNVDNRIKRHETILKELKLLCYNINYTNFNNL